MGVGVLCDAVELRYDGVLFLDLEWYVWIRGQSVYDATMRSADFFTFSDNTINGTSRKPSSSRQTPNVQT